MKAKSISVKWFWYLHILVVHFSYQKSLYSPSLILLLIHTITNYSGTSREDVLVVMKGINVSILPIIWREMLVIQILGILRILN